MTVKANLRIVLLANDVTVAETGDATLWQHTLAAITGTGVTTSQPHASPESPNAHTSRSTDLPQEEYRKNANGSGALEQFAGELRLDPVTVQGACDPSTESPYMYLDVRAWQPFRRNVPPRGNTSIPPIVLAATLLVLWFKNTRLGAVTVNQAQAVLNTIDTRDRNPARGLKNCGWLQTRDDIIKLNPARFDQAIAVARAFCSHEPIEE